MPSTRKTQQTEVEEERDDKNIIFDCSSSSTLAKNAKINETLQSNVKENVPNPISKECSKCKKNFMIKRLGVLSCEACGNFILPEYPTNDNPKAVTQTSNPTNGKKFHLNVNLTDDEEENENTYVAVKTKLNQKVADEKPSSNKQSEILSEANNQFLNDHHDLKIKDDEKKVYYLRNGVKKHRVNINQEPELIELSDDEANNNEDRSNESISNSFSKMNTADKTNDKPDKDQDKEKKATNQYLFKEWDIKTSDCESIEKYYNMALNNTTSIRKIYADPVELKTKFLRFGGYFTDIEAKLNLSEKDGIEISLQENDYNIKINIGPADIHYCVAMFYEPFYLLAFRLSQITSELYYDSLRALETYRKYYKFDPTEIASNCLICQLKVARDDCISSISRSLMKYFQHLAHFLKYDRPKFSFISLSKSREFLGEVFREESAHQVLNMLRTAPFNMSTKTILKYPVTELLDQTVITSDDMFCLRDGEFLNDTILMFYLKYIFHETISKEQREKVHIFNTFFYQSLTKAKTKAEAANEYQMSKDADVKKTIISAAERRHNRVKKWTRNVNIFEKDFLVIPIHKNVHWFVAIVCFPYLAEPEFIKNVKNEVKNEPILKTENDDYVLVANQLISSDDRHNGQKKSNDLNNIQNENDAYSSSNKKRSPVSSIKFYSSNKSNTSTTSNKSTLSGTKNNDFDTADEADVDEDSNDQLNKIEDLDKVCVRRPIILILDSLGADRGKKREIATIKEYLDCEWKAKYPQRESHLMKAMRGVIVRVPLQQNYYDCGIHLLHYVETFLKKPLEFYNMPIHLDKWFPFDEIKTKRNQIKELIYNLAKISIKNQNNETVKETELNDNSDSDFVIVNNDEKNENKDLHISDNLNKNKSLPNDDSIMDNFNTFKSSSPPSPIKTQKKSNNEKINRLPINPIDTKKINDKLFDKLIEEEQLKMSDLTKNKQNNEKKTTEQKQAGEDDPVKIISDQENKNILTKRTSSSPKNAVKNNKKVKPNEKTQEIIRTIDNL